MDRNGILHAKEFEEFLFGLDGLANKEIHCLVSYLDFSNSGIIKKVDFDRTIKQAEIGSKL